MERKRVRRSRSGDNDRKLDKAKYTIVSVLALSLIIFAAIAAFAMLNEGVGKFLSTLASVNPFYYLLALLAVFASELVGFPKWHMFIKKLKANYGVAV